MWLTYAKQVLATLPTNRGVMIVPCGANSTGFSDNRWNPGDDLYEDAVTRVLAALGSGGTNTMHSICWHQGEKDRLVTQNYYATRLDAMIAAMRSAFSSPNLPFICGGTLVGGSQTSANVTNALIDTPNRVNYTGYAPATDLVSGGDNLHFDAASLRTFGGRYFTAYGEALLNT
jgi:hypothetical protein